MSHLTSLPADREVQHSLNVSVTDSKRGLPHSNAEAWEPEFSGE